MIEQEMFFALGFVTAGLVALACLPAVWRRAMRLTARRLRQLVPLSGEEIVAERDHLRATFALDQRRLEQQWQRSEAARASLLADLGRRDVEMAKHEADVARAESRANDLAARLSATQRELNGLWAGAGAAEIALYDLTGLVEKRRWDLLAAQDRTRELESIVDEGRASTAAFETRILGLETRLTDLNQALGVAKAELARTVEAVGRAGAERDAARRMADGLVAERDAWQAERAAGPRHDLIGPPPRPSIDADRRAIEAEQAAAAQRATIDELRIDRDNLAAQLAMGGEARRAAAETIAILRSETAALEAKLMDLQARPAPTTDDVATLRAALRQVSEDVLRMTAGPPPLASASSGTDTAALPSTETF